MLSELNENKIIQIKVHFKVILEEGFKIVKDNSDKFNVYQSLFKRYVYCFESLNTLLTDFDNNKIYRAHTIAIILRASLLDYLTTLYLRTFHIEKKAGVKSMKSSYDEEFEKLLSEQLRRILTVQNKDKNSPRYDHEKFCKFMDNIYLNFKKLFDDSKPLDYDKPVNSLRYKMKDDISPGVIRTRLDNFSQNLKGIDYLHVFSLYDIYSKYDHFGVASMMLEEMEINEMCENMFWSIFHLVDGITFCEQLLKEEVKSKSNFKKFGHELSCLKGTIFTKSLYLSKDYKKKNK